MHIHYMNLQITVSLKITTLMLKLYQQSEISTPISTQEGQIFVTTIIRNK